MIKGLVYLTGLATLALVASVAGVAYKVHEWPWGDYVRNGSKILADKLDPQSAGQCRDDEGDENIEPSQDEPRSENVVRPARAPSPVRHTVRRGDTLYKLARRYYDDPLLWPRIAEANNIRKPSDIRVGRVLIIPPSRLAEASVAGGGARRRDGNRLYDLKLAITPALESVATHSGGAAQ